MAVNFVAGGGGGLCDHDSDNGSETANRAELTHYVAITPEEYHPSTGDLGLDKTSLRKTLRGDQQEPAIRQARERDGPDWR